MLNHASILRGVDREREAKQFEKRANAYLSRQVENNRLGLIVDAHDTVVFRRSTPIRRN